MEPDEPREFLILGRSGNRVVSTLVWGGGAISILLPVAVRLAIPFWTCHDAYLPRFPTKWPALLLVPSLALSVPIGIAVTLFALAIFFANIRTHHRWNALLNLIAAPIFAVIIYWGTWAAYASTGTAPHVEDSLVVNGTEYVLATCFDIDMEGGDVVLYQCDGNRRTCHALEHDLGGIGEVLPESLRYENGNLIVEDDGWYSGPLIYSLEEE